MPPRLPHLLALTATVAACGEPAPPPPASAWHTLIADNERAIEVDEDRAIVWSYEASPRIVHLVERLPDGATTLALSSAHTTDIALVLEPDGTERFRYEAHTDEMGMKLQGLHSITPGPDDTWILTDTINSRVLAVDGTGALVWAITRDNFEPDFATPNDARIVEGEDGVPRLVVCTRGDRYSHVLTFLPEDDPAAPFPWKLERKVPEATDAAFLSQPHNPHDLGGGIFLVSAAGEDRVKWVDVQAGAVLDVFPATTCPIHEARPLGWPRDARVLPSGNLLIADSNHGRVIEVASGARCLSDPGAIVWEYEALDRPYSAIRLHCREAGGDDHCY